MAPKREAEFPFQGRPKIIYLDNGPVAKSRVFQNVMLALGIEWQTRNRAIERQVPDGEGLTQPLSQAGYYETDHHKQLIKDIKGATLEGSLMAVCGVAGSGKTVTL